MPYRREAITGLVVQPNSTPVASYIAGQTIVVTASDSGKQFSNPTAANITLSGTTESQLIADGLTEYGGGGSSAHATATNNPHNVTATQVGLGNVDNTADADKPISTAQQAALDAIQLQINNLDPDAEIGTLDATAFDASTDLPAADKGQYLRVSVAGTITINSVSYDVTVNSVVKCNADGTAANDETGWTVLIAGSGGGLDDVLETGQAMSANRTADGGGFDLTWTNFAALAIAAASYVLTITNAWRVNAAEYILGDGSGNNLPADKAAETTKIMHVETATGKILVAEPPAGVDETPVRTYYFEGVIDQVETTDANEDFEALSIGSAIASSDVGYSVDPANERDDYSFRSGNVVTLPTGRWRVTYYCDHEPHDTGSNNGQADLGEFRPVMRFGGTDLKWGAAGASSGSQEATRIDREFELASATDIEFGMSADANLGSPDLEDFIVTIHIREVLEEKRFVPGDAVEIMEQDLGDVSGAVTIDASSGHLAIGSMTAATTITNATNIATGNVVARLSNETGGDVDFDFDPSIKRPGTLSLPLAIPDGQAVVVTITKFGSVLTANATIEA